MSLKNNLLSIPHIYFTFNLYFLYVGILPACVSTMPSEARKRWVLGLEPVSGRATHALNFGAFSLAPEMFFVCFEAGFLYLALAVSCYIGQAGLPNAEIKGIGPHTLSKQNKTKSF